MTMNLTPDDPRLSAYVLGELGSDDAAAVERAAAADPAIRLSLMDLEKTTAFMSDTFGAATEKHLRPSQRASILKAGRDADAEGKIVPLRSAERNFRPWAAGIGAAAAVACAAVVLSRMGPSDRASAGIGSGEFSEEVALLPMPGPQTSNQTTRVASGTSQELIEAQAKRLEDQPGEYLVAVAKRLTRSKLPSEAQLPQTTKLRGFASPGELRLPVLVGSSSFRWVSGWVEEKAELPPKNAVRVEELINTAAISREPVKAPLRVISETMPSPWMEGSLLTGVQIDGGPEAVNDLELVLRSGREFRILGSFIEASKGRLPERLPAGRRTMLLIESRGESVSDGLGELGYESDLVSGIVALEGPSLHASDGLKHAVLMAGFGLWLRDEGPDEEVLLRMLEAGDSGRAEPVRAKARELVRSALNLAKAER